MSRKDAFDHLEKVENNQQGLMFSDSSFQWYGVVTYHNGYYTLEFDNGLYKTSHLYNRKGIQNLVKDHRLDIIDFSEGQYLYTGIYLDYEE